MNFQTYFPGIVGYKNIFADSYSQLLRLENKISWTPMLTGSENDKPELQYEKRKGFNSSLASLIHDKDFFDFRDKINNESNRCLLDYSQKYGYWQLEQEGWVLLKYEVGDFFNLHTDSSRRYQRQVSSVYYLNDNYSGGELEFSYIDLKIKPESGELLIFPSTNLFSHKAHKVAEGTKYSMANWYN
jgi:Rps23 Pro-64 3,4-dihydroxylase Tpa1-like proline 4-hydroxylase